MQYTLCIIQAYNNIKKAAKKSAAADKVERFKTGGGTCSTTVDGVDERVLALLGNRAQPLQNPFDSDAAYNADLIPGR